MRRYHRLVKFGTTSPTPDAMHPGERRNEVFGFALHPDAATAHRSTTNFGTTVWSKACCDALWHRKRFRQSLGAKKMARRKNWVQVRLRLVHVRCTRRPRFARYKHFLRDRCHVIPLPARIYSSRHYRLQRGQPNILHVASTWREVSADAPPRHR